MIRHLLLAAALVLSTSAWAQLHKCVDGAGKTTYTQIPCPANTKSAPVSIVVPPAPAAPAGDAAKGSGPRTPAEAEQAFRKRRQDEAEEQKKQQELASQAKQKEQICQQARSSLVGLEAGGRQTRFDAKGERTFLDDDQIAQEKDKARKAVEQFCK